MALDTIDMSPAFIKGIEENFSNAVITFDKFHIMKVLGKAVDEVRKKEVKEQEVLRGTRYLWLKNRANLTDKQKETLSTMESLSRYNIKTVRVFHIRENFQLAYQESTRQVGCPISPYIIVTGVHPWTFWPRVLYFAANRQKRKNSCMIFSASLTLISFISHDLTGVGMILVKLARRSRFLGQILNDIE